MAKSVCAHTSARSPAPTNPAQRENARVAQMLAEQRGEAPKPEEPPVPLGWPGSGSPTMIKLYLRPASGDVFKGKMDAAEAAADLGYARRSPIRSKAFTHYDTGDFIAWFTPNRNYQFFKFNEVTVEIDPEHCAVHWAAGLHLIERIERCAEVLGAAVFDGQGNLLTADELAAVATHINAVMKRREREAQAARTVHIDATRTREQCELSFQHITRTLGPRGGVKLYEVTYFDAPEMHYCQGRAHGMRMAKEHIQWLSRHKLSDGSLRKTLESAFAVRFEDKPTDKKSKANVAAGYIECMHTLIKLGAANLNMKWLDRQIEQYEAAGKTEAERAAEFAARMKAARLAKKRQASKRKGGAA